MSISAEDITAVYKDLRDRQAHPRGHFDKAGRWYSHYPDLVGHVRWPSRHYPYSQMSAARSKKFVRALAETHGCKTVAHLRSLAHSAQ